MKPQTVLTYLPIISSLLTVTAALSSPSIQDCADNSYSLYPRSSASPVPPAYLNRQLFLTKSYCRQTLVPFTAIAARTTNTALKSELVAKNLEASDLPPRFEPAPPFLRHFIYKGIAAIKPYLETEGISLEDVSSFVDFEQGELVLAMTSNLDSQGKVEKFDSSLSRPDAKDILAKGVEETLASVGNIKIAQIQELNSLKAIGNRARGFSFRVDFQGLPLQVFGEAVAFRRNDTVALVALGALNHPPTEIKVQDLAERLDWRFLNLTP